MTNVKGLMADYVDTPKSYLGHTGSVTVVTHNVITSGQLPKHMGWTTEGYRDVDHVLDDPPDNGVSDGMYISSDCDDRRCSRCMEHYGYPKLADYLDAHRRAVHDQPEDVRRVRVRRPGRRLDHPVRQRHLLRPRTRRRRSYRGPVGINVPSYVTGTCSSRYYVARGTRSTTPTSCRPSCTRSTATGTSSATTPTTSAATSGRPTWRSRSWTTSDWSGIFVTLPGVDKAAHMWGGVNDPGPDGQPTATR